MLELAQELLFVALLRERAESPSKLVLSQALADCIRGLGCRAAVTETTAVRFERPRAGGSGRVT